MIKRIWEVSELEALATGIVSETGVLREKYCQRAAEALIDFSHLTQPAQAVDVGAVNAVIRELRKWPKEETFYDHRATRLACADKLTAALPNANGKEGQP